jgi:hypothetical protein
VNAVLKRNMCVCLHYRKRSAELTRKNCFHTILLLFFIYFIQFIDNFISVHYRSNKEALFTGAFVGVADGFDAAVVEVVAVAGKAKFTAVG